jgi:hypothetical protein
VIGFIILVLPDNFEENIVKKGIVDCIDITILEDLSQQKYKNLPGYMKLERVLTTCMFMVFILSFGPIVSVWYLIVKVGSFLLE